MFANKTLRTANKSANRTGVVAHRTGVAANNLAANRTGVAATNLAANRTGVAGSSRQIFARSVHARTQIMVMGHGKAASQTNATWFSQIRRSAKHDSELWRVEL